MRGDDGGEFWRGRRQRHSAFVVPLVNLLRNERRKWTMAITKRKRRPWPLELISNLAIFLLLLFPSICQGQQFQPQQQQPPQNARVQGPVADPTSLQPAIHPGIISRVSQSGLNLLAEYLRTRVHRFMRFSALQYNFSVPLPSHNAEISIRSLETAQFDQSAFQSRLMIAASSRELIWSGTEFRAAVTSLIQLRTLDQRRAEFGTSQIPLRLEKVRIELVLGSAVNVDGHLRTEVRQCRIISGELLFENLFRDSANLSAFIPIVHQITLSRLSEMICPIFVAELGPVISNRLSVWGVVRHLQSTLNNFKVTKAIRLNSPLSTALFDHYFLNFGLTNGILYQSSENGTTLPDPGGGGAPFEGVNRPQANGGILLFHRGNVFGILRQAKTRINDFRLPILPPPMAPTPQGPMGRRMVAFQMSNYTLGSLFFWMDQYRKFDYEISQSTIKDKEIAGYLRTECGAKEICAGTLFPALAQNFPNGLVSIKSRTSTFPGVQIERGKAIVTVESRIDAFANHSEQTRRFLTANMRAKLSLQNATFSNYLLRAELGIDTFDISNVQSMVDGIDAGSIEFLVNALNELIIAEDMRHKLKDGIRLPLLLDFEQFGPGEVRFEDGLVLLGADLCFDENCKRSPAATAEQQGHLGEHSVDMDANYYDSVE